MVTTKTIPRDSLQSPTPPHLQSFPQKHLHCPPPPPPLQQDVDHRQQRLETLFDLAPEQVAMVARCCCTVHQHLQGLGSLLVAPPRSVQDTRSPGRDWLVPPGTCHQ